MLRTTEVECQTTHFVAHRNVTLRDWGLVAPVESLVVRNDAKEWGLVEFQEGAHSSPMLA